MEEQLSRINSDLGRVIATVIAREWSAAGRAIAHDAIRGVGAAIIYQRVLK